jgi:hypothetical protein
MAAKGSAKGSVLAQARVRAAAQRRLGRSPPTFRAAMTVEHEAPSGLCRLGMDMSAMKAMGASMASGSGRGGMLTGPILDQIFKR